MKRTILQLIISLLVFQCSYLFSQDVGVGEWRDHLPYGKTVAVAEAGNLIYCATQFSVFYYDTTDNSIQKRTRINGLSDIGISAMAYNSEYKTLLIAYTNTNIDLIKDGNIINIPDIKRKQILGNKTINNISFDGKLAYLSCGFGIVVLDVDKMEFPDPVYYIGPNGSMINILDIAFGNDTIWAASENGIYKASQNSLNLASYTSWSVDGRFKSVKYNAVSFFSNRLFVNFSSANYNSDTLYYLRFDNNSVTRFDQPEYMGRNHLHVNYNKLVVVIKGKLEIYDESLNRVLLCYNPNQTFIDPNDGILGRDGMVWIADNSLGMIRVFDNGISGEFIEPNGPYSYSVFDMDIGGNNLWVASGGHASNWGKLYKKEGVYSFDNSFWTSLNSSNEPAFDTISDMTCVAVDPVNPTTAFVGTWQSGVMKFENGTLTKIFDERNSSLQKWQLANYIAISGMAFDSQNNLWVANSGAPSLISVRENDDKWTAFTLGGAASGIDIGDMMVDSYDQKWTMMRAEHSVLVFTENGTISNPADDKYRILNNATGNGALPGNRVTCFAEDLDGEVWLGTDQGVAVIYSPGNIFNGQNFDAQRILVEVGGYVQYLLESETVTAIAIDGKNRKWIGTDRAGVFLLSPDGTEEILHFTEDNSPLYSNSVTSICINQSTGDVFFGTSKGIISYKGTATNGGETNSDVLVYPNPVRETYSGLIAIKGLVRDADVKITDVAGNLVYSTIADGGQAIWDGNNFSGRRAQTGVYLVWASNEDGSETIVTKILFVK